MFIASAPVARSYKILFLPQRRVNPLFAGKLSCLLHSTVYRKKLIDC